MLQQIFRCRFVIAVFVSLIALPLQLNAQEKSFEGTWSATAETDEGSQTHTFVLKMKNDKLVGTIDRDGEKQKLRNVVVEDGNFKCEFDIEEQATSILVKVEYEHKDNDTLDGSWAAIVDGGEVASGTIVAERVVEWAGTWNSVATLPDGSESKSVLEMKGSNEKIKGTLVSDSATTEIDEISIDGKSLDLAFKLEVQGELRNIEIEADLNSEGMLAGSWFLIANGEEQASGDWEASRAAPAKSAASSKSDSHVVFDGSSMDHFRGYAKEAIGPGWKITDGALHFDGTKSGDIVTKKEYGNCEIEFEWKISEGGNSGVIYRSSLGEKQSYITGPEFQVLDDSKHDGLAESQSTGSLYALYAPENKTLKPVGEWNTAKIILNGNSVEHWLNGAKVVSAEIGSDEWNQKVDGSKFKTWDKFGKNKKGHVCFQDHGNPVWYRNIKIKSLDD